MQNISEHINYLEATKTNTGLINKPSDNNLIAMVNVAKRVFEPLRNWYQKPIIINSFFRSETVNRVEASPHTHARAIQVKQPPPIPQKIRTKKVYIAGKITGRDLEEAKAQFEKAEQFLNKKAKGWQVVNPMKLPHEHDKTYESYMTECIEALRQCDALYVLTGWHSSRGVMREINCAHANRIPIIWEMENKLDLLVKQ